MNIIHHHFPKINSTRTYVKEKYLSFDSSKITFVSADEQTIGQGRFNRTWLSPKGNIYLSAYYVIPACCYDYVNTAQIASLSIIHVLKKEGITTAKIKWPNDILLNNKKVAGVMGETIVLPNDKMGMILSIGLNINMSLNDVCSINQIATSLKIEEKCDFNVKKITYDLLKILNKNLNILTNFGFSFFYEEISSLMAKKNENIYFHNTTGKKHIKGIFKSFNKDGSITIYQDDEKLRTFHSGELTLFSMDNIC